MKKFETFAKVDIKDLEEKKGGATGSCFGWWSACVNDIAWGSTGWPSSSGSASDSCRLYQKHCG